MNSSVRDLSRLRSAALWCAVSAAAAGVALLTVPEIAELPRLARAEPEFVELLLVACAGASLVAAGWLWAITTDVVVRVLAGRGLVDVRRPGAARLLVLAACGAVVVGTTAAPASADDSRPVTPNALAGLPLPDRATGGPPEPHADPTPAMVRVRAGDSLWSIAEERLGPHASVAELADYWHRIYDRNVDMIGPDPDLILPGQPLEVPPTD
jgi:nucleoid-associated protein YgaU